MGRRRVFDGRRTLIGLLMMVSIYGLACRNALCAVDSDSLSIGALKHLSIEELMNLDVTSVSKQPEPYGRAPAAIQVITQNEIRRAGASSIPEALRLAGGARYGPRHGRRNPTPLPGTVAEFAA
jgi:iron complex outermembrane receptor protein